MKLKTDHIRKLIYIHIFMVPVFLFLWDTLGLPWWLSYAFDLLVALEVAMTARNMQRTFRRAGCADVLAYFAIFAFVLLLTQIINLVPVVQAVLAYRRIFRFFAFFAVCAVLLKIRDVEKIFSLMVKLQGINLALTIFQRFGLGVSQDNMGGIFGTAGGVNGYTNIYLCLICTFSTVMYLGKKAKLKELIWVLGSSLLIAALAELKLFFIEVPLIVLAVILLSKPSRKTVQIIFFSALGLVVALFLFARWFPEHMKVFLDAARFSSYVSDEIAGYKIGRLNAFSTINELFFKDDILANLMGFGFGNCEDGSVFYGKYSHYHYTWFTHQVTFLETGYIGIVLYSAFYGLIFLRAALAKKKHPQSYGYLTITQVICLLSFIWMLYNQSQRTESAYLVFWVYAIPIILGKETVFQKLENK